MQQQLLLSLMSEERKVATFYLYIVDVLNNGEKNSEDISTKMLTLEM